jgi:hypothetical protein
MGNPLWLTASIMFHANQNPIKKDRGLKIPILGKLAHHLITTQAVSHLALAGLAKLANADSQKNKKALSAF